MTDDDFRPPAPSGPNTPAEGFHLDPVPVALALAFGVSVALLHRPGPGRTFEVVAVGAAALLSYRVGWKAARFAAGATAVGFLVLEGHWHRLGGAHLARELIAALLVFGVCLAAARSRIGLDRVRAEQHTLREELERIRATEALEEKLGGARRASALEDELERSRRHDHEVSLLLVRPDGFDELQLRFGEPAATDTLSAVAEAIGANLRAPDVPQRLGTFDFGVILPETPSETARVVGERIRLSVAGRPLTVGGDEEVEISVAVGIATFPHDATSSEELVAAARRALSSAAERGGNRTVLTSTPRDAPPGWGVGGGG